MNSQSTFKSALLIAAIKHNGQKLPGTKLPYIVHVTNVALEVVAASNHTPGFDVNFAVTVALLHDTIEDTGTVYNDVKDRFGERVAAGVLALTKFSNLEKSHQMEDSLRRIKVLEKEVWAVKLADRITNLEAPLLNGTRKSGRSIWKYLSLF